MVELIWTGKFNEGTLRSSPCARRCAKFRCMKPLHTHVMLPFVSNFICDARHSPSGGVEFSDALDPSIEKSAMHRISTPTDGKPS